MKMKVILNPYANRWRAKAQTEAIHEAFSAVNLPYDLAITERAGHGTEIAHEAAAAGYDVVVAAGGDGTISEVVNGLITAVSANIPTLPFGVIPIGSANDFSDMVGIPRDLTTAVQTIANGKTRQIDAGQVTRQSHVHYFNNNCAAAMEPMVTLEHIKMTRLSGELRYVVALIKSLVKLRAWQMRVTWDDGDYEGPIYLLSVCNTQRTGGFRMAPEAEFDDGLLDFVLAPEVSKGLLLVLLARLFRGTHVYHPQVTYGRTTQLTIESQPGTPIHADGEIIAEAETAVSYQVLPGKITLLTP